MTEGEILLRRLEQHLTYATGWDSRLGMSLVIYSDPACIVALDSDERSAQALILLLDHLEGLGWLHDLMSGHFGGDDSQPLTYCCCLYRVGREWEMVGDVPICDTRIEAVVRSFIAALEPPATANPDIQSPAEALEPEKPTSQGDQKESPERP